MRRFLKLLTALAFLSAPAFGLGPNSASGNITVVNGNGTTGACTAASCVSQPYHQNFGGGTIFTGSQAWYSTASLQLTGTWVGTISFQYSQDEGATWATTYCYTAPIAVALGTISSTTANGNWICPVQGTTTLRAVATSWTSGTAAVAMEAYTQPAVTAPLGGTTASSGIFACNVGSSVCASGAAGTVIQVKATAGTVLCLDLINTTAAVAYLQIFPTPSASVTLGTTLPLTSVGLAASGTKAFCYPGAGIVTSSGISIAGTTTPTGNTGAAINANIVYQ